MMTAIKEIEAERGISQEHNDLDPLTVAGHDDYPISMGDTSYQGAVSGAPQQYPTGTGDTSYRGAVTTAPPRYESAGLMENTSYEGSNNY